MPFGTLFIIDIISMRCKGYAIAMDEGSPSAGLYQSPWESSYQDVNTPVRIIGMPWRRQKLPV